MRFDRRLWLYESLTILLVVSYFGGCAVQQSKAPQIDKRTAFALNLEAQVTQANRDYVSFFKDVGDARRSGQLSDADVKALNVIGNRLKPIIEEANRLAKVYAQTFDQGIASQVGGLLAQVAADFTLLHTQFTQMKGGNHK